MAKLTACLIIREQDSGCPMQLGVCVAGLLPAHLPPHWEHPPTAIPRAQAIREHLSYAPLIAE